MVAYTPPVQIQGFLTIERWDNIGNTTGTAGQDALKAAIAAGPPTTTFYVAGATLNDQGIVADASPDVDVLVKRVLAGARAGDVLLVMSNGAFGGFIPSLLAGLQSSA